LTQSELLAHEVPQLVPAHTYGLHCTELLGEQVPKPSQP